jgi:hypothetical protein
MNFYLNPDGPANHTGSNSRVNAYNMVKMTERQEREKNKKDRKTETVLDKISTIPNSTNSSLIQEFHQSM